jgi:type II secretory pathway pseudopilin PulG
MELVVALLFVGLLMAGMMRVFSSSIQSFYSQQETIGAQRMGRLAFDQLSEDFQQAGYLYPDRSLAPWMTATAAQKTFQVDPGVTFTTNRPSDSGDGTTTAESITGDVVMFTRDVPLNISATLAADVGPASGTTATLPLTIAPGATDPVRKGDIAIIWDQNFEFFFVDADLGAGTTVTLDPAGNFIDNQWLTGANPEVVRNHAKETPVTFIRPNQVVRYSLQPIALDPSAPTVTVPCLVRQQAPYPNDPGVAINWAATAGTVLAENISQFRVDISSDGGGSWTRTGAWASWKTALNTKLLAQGISGYKGIDVNPAWYKFGSIVFRLDITSRTATRRAEYNAAGPTARAWRDRSLTMLLMPRNFALGL